MPRLRHEFTNVDYIECISIISVAKCLMDLRIIVLLRCCTSFVNLSHFTCKSAFSVVSSLQRFDKNSNRDITSL